MGVLIVDHSFSDNGTNSFSNVPLSTDYMFFATGSFGGGTLALEASPDNGVTWFTVEKLTLPGRLIRYLVSGEKVRLNLCNSIGASIEAGLRQ